MKRSLLIDCNYICHVSQFSIPEMTFNGMHTGVIYGFMKKIIEYSQKFKPDNIAFAWDSRVSIRKEIYPGYKRGRVHDNDEMTEEEAFLLKMAFMQFDQIRDDILPELGFSNIFIQEGYEADDIMASVVKNSPEYFITMVTSDKDMFQLLSDTCVMYNPVARKMISREVFINEWKFEPELWGKARSISGCRTDQTMCIDGVGEKTAAKYLLGNLSRKTKAFYDIEANKDMIEANEAVIILPLYGTLDYVINSNDTNRHKFVDVCDRFGFRSLINGKTLDKWDSIVTE